MNRLGFRARTKSTEIQQPVPLLESTGPHDDPQHPHHSSSRISDASNAHVSTTSPFSISNLWKKRASEPNTHTHSHTAVSDKRGTSTQPDAQRRSTVVDKDLPSTPDRENGHERQARSTSKSRSSRSRSLARPDTRPNSSKGTPRASTSTSPYSTAPTSAVDLSVPMPAPVMSTTSFLDLEEDDLPANPRLSHSYPLENAFRASSEPATKLTPRKSLTRKNSFWSRRKTEAPVPTRSSSDVAPPTLQDVPVSAPFEINMSTLSVSHSSSQEQFSKSQPVPIPSLPSEKNAPQRRRRSRPSTSDGTAQARRLSLSRPSTADQVDQNRLHAFPQVSQVRSATSTSIPSEPIPQSREHINQEGAAAALFGGGRPRQRAQTNPPLLQRLSVSLFNSSSHKLPMSPLSPNASGGNSPIHSAVNSPRPSVSRKPSKSVLIHREEESPKEFMERVEASVGKADIAGVLASSADPFYAEALLLYMRRFDFANNSLDVALRKLLMEIGLPKETQHIDRFVEAFAKRYENCNPGLFTISDHPYVLAFSLIMLHTDAFNRSNKRKMTKADYVKNTRLPGVHPEILNSLYDNIVFAPFIFIEDPLDGLPNHHREAMMSSPSLLPPPSAGAASSILNKTPKIDPYYLITHNLLDPLRVDVESLIPLETPYSYNIQNELYDVNELHHAFVNAETLEVGAVRPYDLGQTSLSIGVLAGSMTNISSSVVASFPDHLTPTGDVWNLRVAKHGLLNRKDDVQEGGRRTTNRKWKTWSFMLTSSQLLLFRDNALGESLDMEPAVDSSNTPFLKPDEIWSIAGAVAVFDATYSRYPSTFRLALADGRQFLLRASDDVDAYAWASRINYASAFRFADLPMRSLGLSDREVEMTGVAAATSHLRDMELSNTEKGGDSWDKNVAKDLMGMLSNQQVNPVAVPTRRVTLLANGGTLRLDGPIKASASQPDLLTSTFETVKADLAAGFGDEGKLSSSLYLSSSEQSLQSLGVPSSSVTSTQVTTPRVDTIQDRLAQLDDKIKTTRQSLEEEMCFVRNVAVMTPFQKATRDRLYNALQSKVKSVSNLRIDLIRATCHRDLLEQDVKAETTEYTTARDIAFRVATATLKKKLSQPQLSLSAPPLPKLKSAPVIPLAKSASAASFHSAFDFGPDLPTWEGLSKSLYGSDVVETPEETGRSSSSSFAFPPVASSPHSTNPPTPLQSYHHPAGTGTPSNDNVLEEAEEWNRTRAANRVSLVQVPSDVRLSTAFKRQSLGPQVAEEEFSSNDEMN